MELAKYIDHTLLKPDATKEQIRQLCKEADTHHFFSVCINPTHVKLAAELLKDSNVKVCTVIGFPLGANSSSVKSYETVDAIENGADEIDMVINVGALKSGDVKTVEEDIASVVEAANGTLVKVIIETSLLTDDEKVTACKLAEAAGCNFVKTSTGFSGGGATVQDVTLMKNAVSTNIEVKASGGVRSREDALSMIEAGATRIGASSGIAIVSGEVSDSDY